MICYEILNFLKIFCEIFCVFVFKLVVLEFGKIYYMIFSLNFSILFENCKRSVIWYFYGKNMYIGKDKYVGLFNIKVLFIYVFVFKLIL